MALFNVYPYTDFQQLNLDWILKELRDLVDSWESYGAGVTATAHTSTTPQVTVTGDLKTNLNFDFGLVQGPRGLTGATGATGAQGPQGEGLEILDEYATLADLQAAHPTGSAGDMYLIGTGGSYTLYLWSTDQSAWVDGGSLTSPSPYSSTPAMDTAAGSTGTSPAYARGDHSHPSDTSKMDTVPTANQDAIAVFDASGQVVDGNAAVTDFLFVVPGAIQNDIAAFDSTGQLYSSNLSLSDVATVSDLSGYATTSDLANYATNTDLAAYNTYVKVVSYSANPSTYNDVNITSDMYAIKLYIGNTKNITGDITVTTSNGSFTVSGGVAGSTTLGIMFTL